VEKIISLVDDLFTSGIVRQAAVGLETIIDRDDSKHLHIRMVLSSNRRSEYTTRKFRRVFDASRITPKSILTTQPHSALLSQTIERFMSYALKDSYKNPDLRWLWQVELTPQLEAEIHELNLQIQDRRVPTHLVTSANCDSILSEYAKKNALTLEQSFITMFLSESPHYHMQFLSSCTRIRCAKAKEESPDKVERLLREIWRRY